MGIGAPVAAVIALLLAGSAQAHVLKDFGPYSVALGWVQEPTYVGQLNAVQVVIKDARGKACRLTSVTVTSRSWSAWEASSLLPLDLIEQCTTPIPASGFLETTRRR